MPESVFTAAQISAALGVSKEAVRQRLAATPGESVVTRGQLARGWRIDALPEEWREKLEQVRAVGGFRSEADVLRAPWQPPIPLAEIAPDAIERAAKLQRALAPSLAREADASITEAEFDQRGVEDYRAAFGHPISARQFRRLFIRTKERDAGRREWGNLALFLETNPPRRRNEPAKVCAEDAAFADLFGDLQGCDNAAATDEKEKKRLWECAFEVFEKRLALGAPSRTVRPALLKFLWRHLPSLAKSPEALRRNFDRKLVAWIAGGRQASALVDKRHQNSGWHRASPARREIETQWQQAVDAIVSGHKPRIDGDLQVWLQQLKQTKGDCAWAFRRCHQENLFSSEMQEAFPFEPRAITRVPKFLLKIGRTAWRMAEKLDLGERAFRLSGPRRVLDHSGDFAMSYLTGDDVTPDVVTWDYDKHGKTFTFRTQTLFFCDCRTSFIFLACAIPAPNYNSRHIFGSLKRIAMKWGFPLRGYKFEGNIWQKARILRGRDVVNDSPAQTVVALEQWGAKQAELGFRRFGLEWKQVGDPQGKIIERNNGWFQKQLKAVPGYVGPDEMHQRFERTHKLALAADSGRIDPNGKLLHLTQYQQLLVKLCEEFNNTPQPSSKLLQGKTPREAFEEMRDPDDLPMKLDAQSAWLLDYAHRAETVQRNGIRISARGIVGGREFLEHHFCEHPRLPFLMRREVQCRFDPEDMSSLVVMDPESHTPFVIPRFMETASSDESRNGMSNSGRAINTFLRPQREVYLLMKGGEQLPTRVPIVHPSTRDMGEQIAAQRAALTQQQRAGDRIAKKARDLRRAGIVADEARIATQSDEDLRGMAHYFAPLHPEKGDA